MSRSGSLGDWSDVTVEVEASFCYDKLSSCSFPSSLVDSGSNCVGKGPGGGSKACPPWLCVSPSGGGGSG